MTGRLPPMESYPDVDAPLGEWLRPLSGKCGRRPAFTTTDWELGEDIMSRPGAYTIRLRKLLKRLGIRILVQ